MPGDPEVSKAVADETTVLNDPVSRLSTKYFHRLQEASKHEPWQARVLGTENQHVKPISTIKIDSRCKELDKGVDPRSAAEKRGNETEGSKSWRPGSVVSFK